MGKKVKKTKSLKNHKNKFRRLCTDCKVDVVYIREWYMVNDHVWQQAAMKRFGGVLCIGCLEDRLERKLNKRDFFCCPLNIEVYFHKEIASKRLRNRLGSWK